MAISLQDDFASFLSHHDTDNSSLLVYGTKKGILAAVDLRSMKTAWKFEIPSHHGYLTSMAVDKQHNWIMSGTHRGILSFWDTRFSVCVKSWQHPSYSSISHLDVYPPQTSTRSSSGSSKLVAMSIENAVKEISVWNIETASCQHLWCSLKPEETDPEAKIDQLYGSGVNLLPVPKSNVMLEESISNLSTYNTPKRIGGRKFAINKYQKFMVSAGTDRKIRLHDLTHPEKSFVLSGPEIDPKPTFK